MAYKLDFTKKFSRSYTKLTPDLQDAVDVALKTLVAGKPYPNGLRVKKMKGHKSVYEASPTMDCRITFHFNNPDYIVLRNVGSHDITLNKP